MRARIYIPTKTSMQSGRGKTKTWVLEYVSDGKKDIDPLMGWVGSSNTDTQIKLKFSTKEQAIAYAEKKGILYNLIEPQKRKTIIKNYADNFAYKKAYQK